MPCEFSLTHENARLKNTVYSLIFVLRWTLQNKRLYDRMYMYCNGTLFITYSMQNLLTTYVRHTQYAYLDVRKTTAIINHMLSCSTSLPKTYQERLPCWTMSLWCWDRDLHRAGMSKCCYPLLQELRLLQASRTPASCPCSGHMTGRTQAGKMISTIMYNHTQGIWQAEPKLERWYTCAIIPRAYDSRTQAGKIICIHIQSYPGHMTGWSQAGMIIREIFMKQFVGKCKQINF